jgi:hypothetical protein
MLAGTKATTCHYMQIFILIVHRSLFTNPSTSSRRLHRRTCYSSRRICPGKSHTRPLHTSLPEQPAARVPSSADTLASFYTLRLSDQTCNLVILLLVVVFAHFLNLLEMRDEGRGTRTCCNEVLLHACKVSGGNQAQLVWETNQLPS